MSYPKKLADIVALMETLPEIERRETLVAYSDQAGMQEPREGEVFDVEDIRKDEECADSVGVFLKVDEAGGCHFRIRLGPQVQTLTRAMTSILCKGLDGLTLEQLQSVPQDFVPKIVGAELVRIRSHTVYYILTRMKSAAMIWNRKHSSDQDEHQS